MVCDPSNQNAQQILYLFTTIIKSFEEYQAGLPQEQIFYVSRVVENRFVDAVYSILLILKTVDTDPRENQGGAIIYPLGMKRLRALEFLKALILTKVKMSHM